MLARFELVQVNALRLFLAGLFASSATTHVVEEAHYRQKGRGDYDDDLHPRCGPPDQGQHENCHGEQKAAETEIHEDHLLL